MLPRCGYGRGSAEVRLEMDYDEQDGFPKQEFRRCN